MMKIILTILALILIIFCVVFAFTVMSDKGQVYWDGYVVASNFSKPISSVTFINGSWIVPEIKPTALAWIFPARWSSKEWVGIGGYNSDPSIVQAGTEAFYNGTTHYWAWYEYFPNGKKIITNFTVRPNDTMYVVIKCLSDCSSHMQIWRIRLVDITQNESYSNTTSFNASRTYGDWVVELPFADIINNYDIGRTPTYFGPVFTGLNNTDYATLSNTTGPIDKFNYRKIDMSEIETVSNLSADGTSFYIT